MKTIILILAIFICNLPQISFGQETENYRLNVAIIGTTNYSDVSFMLKNLKRSAQINNLSLSTSSRGMIEYAGSYHGAQESLVDEIKGLAQDRFAIEIQKQKTKQASNDLSITLRKLNP